MYLCCENSCPRKFAIKSIPECYKQVQVETIEKLVIYSVKIVIFIRVKIRVKIKKCLGMDLRKP